MKREELKMRARLKRIVKIAVSMTIAAVIITGSYTQANAETISDSTISGVGQVTKAGSNEVVSVAPATEAVAAASNAVAPVVDNKPTEAATDNAGLITVDLVIFAGQSNMSGAGGDPASAPAVPSGKGYEFKYGSVPTGIYDVTEPFGITANGYICDPIGVRSGSLVSAFMNQYYKKTGVPVLGISASRGGTDLTFWNNPQVTKDLLSKLGYAVSWCDANNVKIRRKYIVWLQGETDAIAGVSAENYMEGLSKALAPAFNYGVEQAFVITIGQCAMVPGGYDQVVTGQAMLCANDPHFTLATDILHNLPVEYLTDGIHYSQVALNMAGNAAATTAALFTQVITQ